MARFLLPTVAREVEMGRAVRGGASGVAVAAAVVVVAVAAVAAVGLAAAAPARAETTEAPDGVETREAMRAMFSAFASLVARADDPEAFAAPEAREATLGELRTLRSYVAGLEEEGGSLNASHRQVRRTLSDDVAGAIDAFVLGNLEGARFLIGQMAESCFACHSKLPAAHPFDLGARLLESPAVAEMSLDRRAMMAVVARQFDTALDLHEAFFADRAHSAVEVALSGAFESYLKVALRVVDDRPRAVRALRTFRSRPDVPLYLAAEIDDWLESLAALPSEEPPDGDLERARAWIREGQLRTAYPGDRRGLVHFVMASRELHRHLASGSDDAARLAETFYLLGLCEILCLS